MKIALMHNKKSPNNIGAYIEKVIAQRGIECSVFGVEEYSIIPKGFDLYLRVDHGDYKDDIPENLHPSVFYAIDTHLKKPYKKMKRQVMHYDIVFCAQKDGAVRFHKEVRVDTQWIPLGCDREIHKKLDIPKKYDIGFVGRDAQKFARGKHLELLKKRYPNSFIGTSDYKNIPEIYSASKIGFNSSIRNDINKRIFEIMSCGCFLLTNYIKGNGFNELFKDKEHLVVYRNDKELIQLIDYYLNNDKERERIADSGHRLAVNINTIFHRVQAMFNYIAFKFGGEFNKLRI